jgi:hypothetical protein
VIKIASDSDDFKYIMDSFGGKFGKLHKKAGLWRPSLIGKTNGWNRDEDILSFSARNKEK